MRTEETSESPMSDIGSILMGILPLMTAVAVADMRDNLIEMSRLIGKMGMVVKDEADRENLQTALTAIGTAVEAFKTIINAAAAREEAEQS